MSDIKSDVFAKLFYSDKITNEEREAFGSLLTKLVPASDKKQMLMNFINALDDEHAADVFDMIINLVTSKELTAFMKESDNKDDQ